jgi:aerobic carbon-monoxide dehydrogenase small subunit
VIDVELVVDGQRRTATVEPGARLVDVLRDDWDRTGTRIGCLTGDCGACTVLVDGATRKSCLLLAAAVDGEVTTIQGVAAEDGGLTDVQQAFWDEHAFQCGYCTAGMVLVVGELLEQDPHPTDQAIRRAVSGNLCRCTGYEAIVAAARRVADGRAAPTDCAVTGEDPRHP